MISLPVLFGLAVVGLVIVFGLVALILRYVYYNYVQDGTPRPDDPPRPDQPGA